MLATIKIPVVLSNGEKVVLAVEAQLWNLESKDFKPFDTIDILAVELPEIEITYDDRR